jgi:hypothetical protein
VLALDLIEGLDSIICVPCHQVIECPVIENLDRGVGIEFEIVVTATAGEQQSCKEHNGRQAAPDGGSGPGVACAALAQAAQS